MIVLCMLAVVGVAAGCAGDEQGGGAGGAPSPTPAPAPSVSLPAPTASKQPASPTVTLVGEVKAGVEAGCLVLEAEGGGGTWLLLEGDRSVLKVGARVQVTGSEATGILTTCQQGRPFTVRSARPA